MEKTFRKLIAIILVLTLIIPANAFVFADMKGAAEVTALSSANIEDAVYYTDKNGEIEYFSNDPNKVYAKNIKPATEKVTAADVAKAAVTIPKTDNVKKGQLKSTVNIERNKAKKESTVKNDKLAKDKTKNRPKASSNELIIKFKDNVGKNTINSLYQKNSLKAKKKLNLINAEVVTLPKNVKAEDMINKLKADKNIEYVEPNYIYYPSDTSDPYFNQLWGLENIGQEILGMPGEADVDIDINDAWNEYGQGSNEVVIGVIDTGVDINHPDLVNQIWINQAEANGIPGIDDDSNGYVDDINGWDFYNMDNSVFDAVEGDEHGTHVSGTIAATANNNTGVVGISANVKIMPLKFLGPQGGYTDDAIMALEYAKKMGVKITNNSWGGGGYSQALKDAIEESGILFVASAGNNSENTDAFASYPSSYDSENILSVAAIENTGELADFSNFGLKSVDVAAPGAKILSSVPRKYPYTAALQSETATHKTMFDGFGLENLATDVERQDLMSKALDFFGVTPDDSILLVQDDASDVGELDVSEAYLNTLQALGYTPTLTKVGYYSNGPDKTVMDQYDLVIWFTGNSMDSGIGTTITDTDQVNLINYLNAGANLYLSGRDAGWNIEYTEFYYKYLHASFLGEEVYKEQVIGYDDTLYAGAEYNLNTPNYWNDYLMPYDDFAKPVLHYEEELTYDNAYAYYSGTSMAAPHVTGIAALLLSNGTQDPILMKKKIMMGAEPYDNLTGMVYTGGVVNAANSLRLDIEMDDDIPGVELKETNTGTLDMDSDLDDVYYVDAEAGDMINVYLSGDTGTDFDLHIYDPSSLTVKNTLGLLVSSENEETSTEVIKFAAPYAGRYYIDVYAYSGAGSYTLNFDKNIEVDDNDPALIYSPNWTQLTNNNLYINGSAHKLSKAGSALYNFNGSSVKLTAFKDNTMGIARVLIDGKAVADVNLYAASPQYKQVVFERSLPYGNHNLEIRWTGLYAKGARKTSTAINLDMITIGTTKTPPSAPTEFTLESYLEAISVEFRTNQTDNVGYYTIYRSEDNVNFEDIAWIDNSIDPYTGYWDNNKGQGLEDKDYYYYVTAVNIYGMESNPTPILSARPQMPNSAYILEDTSNHIAYQGTWDIDSNEALSGGTRHVTLEAGAKVYIPFTGYRSLVYLGGPSDGVVRITRPGGYVNDYTIIIDESDYNGWYGFGTNWGSRAVDEQWTIEVLSGKIGFDYAENKDIDFEAPSSNSTLDAAENGNVIDLSWKDNYEADVASYNIYRSEVSGQYTTPIASTTGNPPAGNSPADNPPASNPSAGGETPGRIYTDSTVQPGKTYYYTIAAVDYAGNESVKSNEAVVVTQLPVPAAPQGLIAVDDAGKVKLDWTQNAETYVTGYNVYRADISGDAGTLLTTTTAEVTTFTDANVTAGSTYYYTITAVNTSVESARSAEVSYTVPLPAPAAPTGLTAANNGTGINLSWGAVTSNAAGYNVYRSNTAGGVGTLLTSAPITGTTYSDSAVTHGTTYYYTVTAVNSSNLESVKSAEVSMRYIQALTAGYYEETDSRLSYGGSWTTSSSTVLSGGRGKYSITASAFVEFTFKGTGFNWIGIVGPNRGKANIYIDGAKYEVDTYNASTIYKKVVFSNNQLVDALHVVRIEVLGLKNQSSTGISVTVDAFEIIQ